MQSDTIQLLKKKNWTLLERVRLDVSSESSARQSIHMKYQALFP